MQFFLRAKVVLKKAVSLVLLLLLEKQKRKEKINSMYIPSRLFFCVAFFFLCCFTWCDVCVS